MGQTSLFLVCSILSLFTSSGFSLKLDPVYSSAAGLTARAAGYPSLALQNNETFLWSGASSNRSAQATFTLYTKDDSESIINLEGLRDVATSIQCTNTTVTIQLDDSAAFAQLQSAWDWTNQEQDNSLILIAGSGQCGWNEDRQPFTISKIAYKNSTNTAVLTGKSAEWTDLAANYDLHVGTQPGTNLARRDIDKDYTLDFNHDIGFGNWSFPIDSTFSVGLTCKTCYTTGDFTFDFDIKTRLGIPVDASLTLQPQGVSAVLDPTVSLSGNIVASKQFKDTFLRIPIDGITIASIIDLGPEIAFSGALTIGPLKGTAAVTTGVTVTVEDSAEMYIDLLSSSHFNVSGWSPQVTGKTPTVTESISAGVSLGVLADVEFDVTVLGEGLSAGIGLQPLVGVTLSAIDSESGACASDPNHDQFGVQLAPSAGIWLQASVSDVATVTITSETISLPTDCVGLSSPATSTLPTVSSSPAISSSSAVSSSHAVPTSSSAVVTSVRTTLTPSSMPSGVASSTPYLRSSSSSASRIPTMTPIPKKF